MSSYGTMAGSNYTMTFIPSGEEGSRPKTPPGLMVTQAVQTMDGWLGQIIVDKTVVFQTVPMLDPQDAIQAANTRVVDAIKTLFAAPPKRPVIEDRKGFGG